jgi:hypothetical protein
VFDLVVKYFSPLKHIPLLPHVFDAVMGIFTAITNKKILVYIDRVEHKFSMWEGVKTTRHKYGGLQFNYANKEIGHIHSNGLLDIHFPVSIRNELIERSEAIPHHIFKDSGWISFYIREESDVNSAIELLARSYTLKR